MYLLILLSLATLCSAELKSCPKVQPVRDFNITAYGSGVWYEIARSFSGVDKNTDCVFFTFTPKDEGFILEASEVTGGKLQVVDGSAFQHANETGIGKLTYDYHGYQIKVDILVVDYNKFSVEYGCVYNETDQSIEESLWVISRTKTVDKETKEEIERALASTGISNQKIVWDHFTEESCHSDTLKIQKAFSGRLSQPIG